LTIEHGFSEQLRRGETAAVQALLDGSDSNTAGVVMGYLGRMSNDYNTRLQLRFAERHLGMKPRIGRVELACRAWFNDNLESPPFYVPAVITNILFVITMLLSGFAFPIESMPVAVQWLTLLNPLRFYMVTIRGIFLKGVGFGILWPQLAALTAIGLAVLLVAVERFRKTVG